MKNILSKFVSGLTAFAMVLTVLAPLPLAKTAVAETLDLPLACGLDIVLVMDESASIGTTGNPSDFAKMQNAMIAFVEALEETPTEFALVDFGTLGHIRTGFTDDPDHVIDLIDNGKISSSEFTNWHQGLEKAKGLLDARTGDRPGLVIFASDGNPNRYGEAAIGSGSNFSSTAHSEAILVADTINAYILGLGIGSDLDVENIEDIADYVITGGFDDLAETLAELAVALCGGTLTVIKEVNDGAPQAGWTFKVEGEDLEEPIFLVTGDDGKDNTELPSGTYTITEVSGPDGWEYTLTEATCSNQSGELTGQALEGVEMGTEEDILSCTFTNDVKLATIVATKIWCPTEGMLPNWGANDNDYEEGEKPSEITPTVIQNFLEENTDCEEIPWDFEWTPSTNDTKPNNNAGALGGDWTEFVDGVAIVPVVGENSFVWVREQMKDGYVPFSGTANVPADDHNDYSAEIYCHIDVLNYDNYDRVDNLEADKTYYCVAFNAPIGGNQDDDPVADLEISKSVSFDGQELENGDSVEYTITVSNLGPNDATEVSVTDNLPLCLEVDSESMNASQGSANLAEQALTWTVGDLADEESATLTFTAMLVDCGEGELANEASVTSSGDTTDPNPNNNKDDATVTVGDEDTTPNPEPEQPTKGPSGNGGGVINRGGGFIGFGGSAPAGQVLGEETEALCSFAIDTYMRKGHKNNTEQVKVLQWLLNKYANPVPPLVIDGIFGSKTEASVKAFQALYADEILKNAWGISAPTGIFFRSTLAKAKNLECPDVPTPLPVGLTNDYNWSKSLDVVPTPTN